MKFLRITLGLIVAFFVCGIIILILRPLGLIFGGLIVTFLNLSPNPDLALAMSSLGNIIAFILALYPAIKVYKKIAGTRNVEKQLKEEDRPLKSG